MPKLKIILIFLSMVFGFSLQSFANESDEFDKQKEELEKLQEEFELKEQEMNRKALKKRKRKPIDLIAFPNSGETILGLSYDTTREKNELLKEQGINNKINFSKSDTTAIGLGLDAKHAFNDYWAIGLEMDLLLSKEKTVAFGPASPNYGDGASKYKSKGMGDIFLSVIYRLSDFLRGSNYDMNISYFISPKFTDKDDANTTAIGNNGKGRVRFGSSVEWGRRSIDFSWSMNLIMAMHDRGKSKKLENDITVSEYNNSFADFAALASWQWIHSPTLTWNLNVGIGSVGKIEVDHGNEEEKKYHDREVLILGGGLDIDFEKGRYLRFILHTISSGGQEPVKVQKQTLITTKFRAQTLNIEFTQQF